MTPAQDIPLTLESVLANARPSLQKKILYSIDLIRKSEKMALRLDPMDGFYNTFSVGKDSQCLYHLVKLSGVKAKTHMNLTSVDPPEVYPVCQDAIPGRGAYQAEDEHLRDGQEEENVTYTQLPLVLYRI